MRSVFATPQSTPCGRYGVVALVLIVWAISSVNGGVPTATLANEAPDVDRVPCVTCEGKGKRSVDCGFCSGKGKTNCSCVRRPSTPPAEMARWRHAAAAKKLEDAMAEARETLLKSDAFRSIPDKRTSCGSCTGGKMLMTGARCPVCAGKGHVACLRCKRSGKRTCPECDGVRRLETTCTDCAGVGSHRVPHGALVEQCPWCVGDGMRRCGHCSDSPGKIESNCRACGGSGKDVCSSCKFAGRVACKRCGARGKVREIQMPTMSTSVVRCPSCKGRKVAKCDCKRQHDKCQRCKGTGIRVRECACVESLRSCSGCQRGAFEAWEYTGKWLLAEGDPALASRYLRVALERAEADYVRRVEVAQEHDLPTHLLEDDRDEKLESLRELLATADSSAGSADGSAEGR